MDHVNVNPTMPNLWRLLDPLLLVWQLLVKWLPVWHLPEWWVLSLAMSIDGFGFGGGWFHDFSATGCAASGFATAGLAAVGFEELGSVVVGLAAVGVKQHQVHCTNASETTSVTNTPEHNAAKPDVGKAMGLSMPFLADVTINQILRIN